MTAKQTQQPILCSLLRNITAYSLVFLLIIGYSGKTLAQCATAPTPPACNPSGSSALVNNDVVGAGQVKTVSGSSSFSSLTVSGGTLIVCGALTLTSFTFNSGVIIVNPGGSVQINVSSATVFGAFCTLYNYGNFTITGSIVTGSNNLIFNCTPSSVLTIAFNQFVIQGPNTYVINRGVINTSYVIVQSQNSPNPICLAAPSAIVTNYVINQYANSFISPEGPSCFNITQGVINNQNMTASSNMNICYQASNVSFFTAPFFGAATVNSNCPNCGVILPLKITSFNASCGNTTRLTWSSEEINNTARFDILYSVSGHTYDIVGSVFVEDSKSSTFQSFSFNTQEKLAGYFKIKQVEKSGEQFETSPIFAKCNSSRDLVIYPNTGNSLFNVESVTGIESVKVYSSAGALVKTSNCNMQKQTSIELNNDLPRGIYLFVITTGNGETKNQKIILE